MDKPETMGWIVHEPAARFPGEPKKLSRLFTVKSSAETCLQLLRNNGFPKAYLHEVVGAEGRRVARRK